MKIYDIILQKCEKDYNYLLSLSKYIPSFSIKLPSEEDYAVKFMQYEDPNLDKSIILKYIPKRSNSTISRRYCNAWKIPLEPCILANTMTLYHVAANKNEPKAMQLYGNFVLQIYHSLLEYNSNLDKIESLIDLSLKDKADILGGISSSLRIEDIIHFIKIRGGRNQPKELYDKWSVLYDIRKDLHITFVLSSKTIDDIFKDTVKIIYKESLKNKNLANFINISVYEHFGYRSGDLENKAEDLLRMDSNRSTGHFGSGFYFFGNEKDATTYDNRLVSKVEFDDYNLFKVKNKDAGLDLHEALKKFNNGIFQYTIINAVIKQLTIYGILEYVKGYDIFDIRLIARDILSDLKNLDDVDKFNELLKGNLEEILINYDVDDESAKVCLIAAIEAYKVKYAEVEETIKLKMINNLNNAFKMNGYSIGSNHFDNIWNIYLSVCQFKIDKERSEWKNIDTASTSIMKYLGFDGIDVIGIDGLDNSMYGSVIYDIK